MALIDVPYYSLDLAKRIKRVAQGKPLLIIFTHSDFLGVAEVDNWRNSFESVRIVAHDSDAMKGDVERLVGNGPWQVGDFHIHAAPGHTEGSLIVSSRSRSTSFGGDSAGVWEGKLTGFPEMASAARRNQCPYAGLLTMPHSTGTGFLATAYQCSSRVVQKGGSSSTRWQMDWSRPPSPARCLHPEVHCTHVVQPRSCRLMQFLA